MGIRRKSRELALQMLFQSEMGRQSPAEVEKSFWASREKVDAGARAMAEELFRAAREHAKEIDALIAKHAQHWRLERMAAVDRNLLRAAVAEFMALRTPPPVLINEALEVVRKFSGPESVQFINGVLDSICRELATADDSEPSKPPRRARQKRA